VGSLIAGIFRPISTGTKVVAGSKSTTGIVSNWKTYGGNGDGDKFNVVNVADSTQVGKGNSPPTREDFNIEVPFTNGGIEDNPVNSGTYGYDGITGKISIPTLISPTFGSGSITEVCHFCNAKQSPSGAVLLFLYIHDIIAPVNFINGESLNVDYEVLI